MVSASGMNVSSEVITSKGRIDLVVEFEKKIYIIEFKCNQSAKAGIKQIKNKGYAEKYGQTNKKLILMGINFSSENKNVEEWKIENSDNV
jgi:Holliday junction resolvase-like predicted endonuclease